MFGWIASLPLRHDEFKVDLTRPSYTSIADNTSSQWPFIVDTLYHTGGNDAEGALNRARLACVCVGVVLGAIIAFWSYQLGGMLAAIFATCLFAFDPNFLGHAGVVKNDVMLSAAGGAGAVGLEIRTTRHVAWSGGGGAVCRGGG